MLDKIIFLGCPIYDETANIIQAQLLFLESVDPHADIQIYCNSGGGSVVAGLGIYDTMQYVSPDVCTCNVGMCASMAAVLLAAGAPGKRTALKHSRTMIHQPSGGVEGDSTTIEISYKEIMKFKKELYEILAKHTGQPYKKIEKDSDRDYWMNSQESLEYHMIDEILSKKK
jgi:ATP-dependent Clp protease protease subunit